MPKLGNRLPKYRKHRASGQAVVTLNGRDFYLGPHGTKASRVEYDRLVAEWLAQGRNLSPENGGTCDLTVAELVARYLQFAKMHYRKDGKPTSELDSVKNAMRPFCKLYGHTFAGEFTPLRL